MNLPAGRLQHQKRLLGLCILVVVFCLPAASSIAFHEKGVANCNGCHIMHNSEDGQAIDPDNPPGNMRLLNDGTASDVCLSCHADQLGAVLGSNPIAPSAERGPGNFVFLYEDNISDGPGGAAAVLPGHDAGHNLNAPSYGLTTDPRHTHAPGGGFSANKMGCTACHDPHGNTNYRMLHGAGPIPGKQGYHFSYGAPVAEGLPLTGGIETDNNHVAYQSGMSLWCQNCHHQIHQQGAMHAGSFIHPVDQSLTSAVITQYNQYNGTADPTGGTAATAYLPAVPFEAPGNTVSQTTGPSGNSKLSCMTCHRAHATSGPDAGRWDFNVDYLSEDGVASGSYPIPNPYPGVSQAPLCEKCHATTPPPIQPATSFD